MGNVWRLACLWAVLDLAAPVASAEQSADLPPVIVPLPDAPSAPESTTRRDPTGAATRIEVGHRREEAAVASELVGAAPGVLTQDRGGLLQTKSLSLRGASSNGVLVLLDGVPINGSGGGVDLSRIPLSVVERFEVLRGAAGARYGSGGLGGVVNVVTRRPEAGGVLSGAVSAGSFDTAQANVTGAGALWGGHGLLVLHGGRSEGGFDYLFDEQPAIAGSGWVSRRRENNDVQMGGGLLRYRRALGAQLTLDGSAELLLDGRGLAGTAQNPTPSARSATQRLTASTRLTRPLEAGELSVRGWARRDRSTFQRGFFGADLPQTELSVGLDAAAERLWGMHGLSASVQLGYDGIDSTAVLLPTTNPSWFRAGLMVADELLLASGRASVIPSVRVDLAGPFATFSPKLGASLALPGNFLLRANVGQAHRAPSFLELYVVQGTLLPNPSLRPERALGADLGLSHTTEATHLSLTAFHTLYEDLIAYELYPPLLARPYNFNTARAQGVELEARASPHERLAVEVAWTLTSTANLRDDPRYHGKPLPYRPLHRVVGRVSGGSPRARARAELDLQSAQAINRSATVWLPARAFLNLGVTGRLWADPRLSASLDVKNVLDVQSADFDGYPLPGRAAYVTVGFALDRERR
jgi:vitamin B12 transporter